METILLIENDPAALVAQSLLLRCFGYTVLVAGDRGEAWRTCVEHGGQVHLILMDFIFNDHITSNFVARLQLVCPQLRALFFSEASPAELAEKQYMPCECAFVQKPFRADALANTIRGLLDGPKKREASSL